MKVAELQGALLDYWVAMGGKEWESAHKLFPTMTLDPTFKGVELFTFEGGRTVCRLVPVNPFRQDYQIFAPSTAWAHGGPIIGLGEAQFIRERLESGEPIYFARIGLYGETRSEGSGPTHLIAAMRAYVAGKFGDEVPDEVVP